MEIDIERFYHAFYHVNVGVAFVDLKLSFLEINETLYKMLGYTAKELMATNLEALIDTDSKPSFKMIFGQVSTQLNTQGTLELNLLHKNKQKLWVSLTVSSSALKLKNDTPCLMIQIQDRTEHRYFEERLLYLTTYNSLTGLMSRNYIFTKINELIHNKKINQFTLYYIDIDRFKRVNETYGTNLSDPLIKNIAEQLRDKVSANDLLGYLGGNEFIIISPNNNKLEDNIQYAEQINALLRTPLLMQNNELALTASLGICQYPKDGTSITMLLKAANIAMRESKRHGGDSISVYHPKLNKNNSNHLLIESDLRKALDKNKFLVYYQPIINAHTNKPHAVEALVRWQKEDHLIPPDEFIPIAEESSLIVKIGEKILMQACDDFSQLQKKGISLIPERLSINMSARQFSDANLIPMLKNVLKTQKFAPEQLELEITETMLIQNIREIYETISKVSKMGIKIAVDDFGTGYSSLSYLKDLPINRLKIDKSFINLCTLDYNSQSIIDAIISLAHRIGLEVTAEGVETKEQQQFLTKQHCDELQGYYFSHPIDYNTLCDFFGQNF